MAIGVRDPEEKRKSVKKLTPEGFARTQVYYLCNGVITESVSSVVFFIIVLGSFDNLWVIETEVLPFLNSFYR